MSMSKKVEIEKDGGSRTEMFYTDALGQKQDVSLHEDMLDNTEADEKWRKYAKKNSLESGMSQEDADNIFGPD